MAFRFGELPVARALKSCRFQNMILCAMADAPRYVYTDLCDYYMYRTMLFSIKDVIVQYCC